MIKIGEKVKDFTLKDANGKSHSLSDYLGKKVVVYFYPKNDTPGCTAQACGFRDNYELYQEKGIVILGISKDDEKSHALFQEKYHLTFPTLSDPDLEVIKYFGAYGKKKFMGKEYDGVLRRTFIIDEKGILIKEMPDVSAKNNALEVLEIIDNL